MIPKPVKLLRHRMIIVMAMFTIAITFQPVKLRAQESGTVTATDMPRASEIIGLPAVNNQQQNLGKVIDVIIGNDGRVSYLVVSRGGVIGMGYQLYAIPWKASNPKMNNNTLLIDISKEQFEGAPKFVNWLELRSAEYRNKVQFYYNNMAVGESLIKQEDRQKEDFDLKQYVH